MGTQQDLQDQINTLRSEVEQLRKELDLIANLLSRHGTGDPRMFEPPFEILDRLDEIEDRLDALEGDAV